MLKVYGLRTIHNPPSDRGVINNDQADLLDLFLHKDRLHIPRLSIAINHIIKVLHGLKRRISPAEVPLLSSKLPKWVNIKKAASQQLDCVVLPWEHFHKLREQILPSSGPPPESHPA